MVRIANILNSRGEVMKAVGLWKAARPLFKRSSQLKDITQVDVKLGEVDSAALVEYEEKPQHLSELCVPGSAPEEEYIAEDKQEEDNKLAHTSEARDTGRQGILV
jgi:DTW domain-containing protein YfiP